MESTVYPERLSAFRSGIFALSSVVYPPRVTLVAAMHIFMGFELLWLASDAQRLSHDSLPKCFGSNFNTGLPYQRYVIANRCFAYVHPLVAMTNR